MTLAGLAIAASLIVGCSPTRVELDYGNSQRLVKMNQIIDPQAGQTDKPVTNMDGEAAKSAHEAYRQSFIKSKASTSSILDQ